MNKFIQLSLWSILGLSLTASANSSGNSLSSGGIQRTATVERNIDLKALEQADVKLKAQEWGITTEEWQRYLELQKGERGMWSPNLDPLTTLGIEAKTEDERERYAELLAQKMYQRVERELAFQRAYDRAFAKLYPNESAFTVEPHISQSTGRVVYFTRLDDCSKCESDVSKILARAGNKTPIDVYFVGAKGNDAGIIEWAKKHKIDPNKVKQRLITLNHDSGYWLNYALGKMPSAFQIQGDGQWQALLY